MAKHVTSTPLWLDGKKQQTVSFIVDDDKHQAIVELIELALNEEAAVEPSVSTEEDPQ